MIRRVKNFGHLLLAFVANLLYGFPSRKLVVIGVTGTDGKTTTTSLIYHILKKSGKKVAMISTVGAYIGDKVSDVGFHVTTPSSFAIQKYLRKALDQGNTHIVLEVTSHALDQNRIWGIHFSVGVLTNVSHEHLDYHKTYERYVAAKAKLLKSADIVIVNRDDKSFNYLKPYLREKKVITYGLGKKADETPKTFPIHTTLIGTFNLYNSLAAALAAKEVHIPFKEIEKGIHSFTPPTGRQEIVYKKDFKVMIDFAHTPNAFHVLLPDLKRDTKGRLIHVFGSASKRDVTKRPIMGRESSDSADIIILTAEDPRNESIEKICREIASGIKNFTLKNPDYVPKEKEKKLLYIIPDRIQAIETAIAIARKEDYVVVTGKSHEKSMNYGKGEVPWDEFAVVKEAIEKRNQQPTTHN